MNSMRFLVQRALGALALSAAAFGNGDLPSLVLSADVSGQVDACGSCSAANRRGGAASWPAAAAAAGGGAGSVWLDAGGFLFGAADPALVAGTYAALDYSAINLAAADFRLGLAFTLEAIGSAELPAVSTNLLGANGEPIAEPFRVVEVDGSLLAILGVAEAPAALAYLPTLQEQLAGITFDDPLVAIERVLPEAEAAADRVVLLVHGTRPLLMAVQERYGSRVAAICVGGLLPGEAQRDGAAGSDTNDAAPIVATRPGATHLAVLPKGATSPAVVMIPVSADPSARVLAALTPEEVPLDPALRTAKDSGLILTIHGTEHADHLGKARAKDGHGLLVIDLEIENNIPLELAFGGEREEGERLLVAFKQNLLLVSEFADSQALNIREALDISSTEGALPHKFELSAIGSVARGKVAFELPLPIPDAATFDAARGGSHTVWLENDELDPSTASVFGTLRDEAPIEVAHANEYLEFALPSVQFHKTIDGRTAPPGLRWAEVLLVGTSARILEGGRPKAALYLEAAMHMQLVTDGMWAHVREPGLGTLPSTPGFVHGYPSGGTAVFLVPEASDHVALELVFPLLQNVGGPGVDLKLETLVFDLEGADTAAVGENALAVVDDDPVDMAVIEVSASEGAPGRAVVELDVRLRNTGEEDGELNLTKRFRGGDVVFMGVFGQGGEPLSPSPLLPAGEKRALRVRLDVANSAVEAGTFEVSYSGITVNPTLRLPIGERPEGDAAGPPVAAEHAVEEDPAEAGPVAVKPVAVKPVAVKPVAMGPVAADPVDVSNAFAPELAISRGPEPGETPSLNGLRVSGKNAAVELRIEGASLVDSVGTTKKRDGIQYLVLDTRWLSIAEEPEELTEPLEPYEIDRMTSLHLIYNGGRLLLERGLSPVNLPRRLRVPTMSDERDWLATLQKDPAGKASRPREVTGQLVYAIPAGELRVASLLLLDPANGNVSLDLFGSVAPAPRTVPAVATASNGLVEAAVLGMEVLPVSANATKCNVAVDLVVASLRRADPRDFEGRAEAVAHLLDPTKDGSIHLLFDGEFPSACSGKDLEAPLWCLPSTLTGGTLQFTVPTKVLAEAATIDLVIGMREAAVPMELIRRPAPLVLSLRMREENAAAGAGMASASAEVSSPGFGVLTAPRWTVDDGGLTASFHNVHSPVPDRPWVQMVVRLTNARQLPVHWQPAKALALLAPMEGQSALTATAPVRRWLNDLRLPYSVQGSLWIPAGSTRTVELRFQCNAPPTTLRYSGLVRRIDFSLAEGEGALALAMPHVDGHAVLDRTRAVMGIKAVGLRGQDVNRAIDRGRDWMLATLAGRDRSRGLRGYLREDIVMMLALVHAGAHTEFPEFDEQLQSYLDLLRPGTPEWSSAYPNGLLAMLLDAYNHPRYRLLLRDVTTYLVNAQGPDGTWGYKADLPHWLFGLAPVPEAEGPSTGPLQVIGGADRASTPLTDAHVRLAGDGPVRRQVEWSAGNAGDNSLTQYAVLGLHAAERQGIEIDPDVWRRALGTAWVRQSSTNGWPYVAGSPYGTMTCAGATITAIAMRSLEPLRDPTLDPRIRAGLGWLAQYWAVDKNPDEKTGSSKYLYYYYYGLERTGRLLDTEFFGAHEWYATVAKRLVAQQSASGAWPATSSEAPTLTTAFAVLFLTRATETLDPEALAREHAAKDAARPTTGRLEMRSLVTKDRAVVLVLDASGSMLAPPGSAPKSNRTPKFEYARAALREVVAALPEGAPVGLVVYGHRKRAREEGADKDVEVLIPVGPLRQAAFLTALERLKPRGKTPLALSLDEALKGLSASSRKDSSIVLLTDGGQGREPGDPIKSAERVGRANVALEIVAFDIGAKIGAKASKTQVAWNAQIEAMAEASGGRLVSVTDADRLASVVSAAATGRPGTYKLLDEAGTVVHEGAFGGTLVLDPGNYVFRTTFGDAPYEAAVTIERDRTIRIEFDAKKIP